MRRTTVRVLQLAFLNWYSKNRRRLPWRTTRDPYRILVSEVMLQQTQVDRVLPKYRAFLKRWPTLASLARARRSSVIRAWSGLGYNGRAIHLHAAARAIVADYGGRFPRSIEALQRLPGVGPYTARAVATFAGFTEAPFIDTNARRVLGRVVQGSFFPTVRADRRLLAADRRLLPPGRAAAWHQALMDLGALVCKPRPLCQVCPLRRLCRAYPAVLTATRPRRAKAERFEDSNRYWRGQLVRIFAKLSPGRSLSHQELHRQLKNLPAGKLQRLLRQLVADGLLATRGSRYQLGG